MAKNDWKYSEYEDLEEEASYQKIHRSKTSKPKKTWKQVNEQKQKKIHGKKWKNKKRSGYDKHRKNT